MYHFLSPPFLLLFQRQPLLCGCARPWPQPCSLVRAGRLCERGPQPPHLLPNPSTFPSCDWEQESPLTKGGPVEAPCPLRPSWDDRAKDGKDFRDNCSLVACQLWINAFQTSVCDQENRQSLFSLLWGTEQKFNFSIVVRKLGLISGQ